ncbi:pyruvate dehydrogenase (acetyl-transferring) E1 component subunit alpha [Hyalomma marginatum]|uniref:Pyruvate dehydrogenase E1 component subunit alpha n=1 Tax=Hyalomma marginatum TaxID=34627 RepID=A0A8S4C1N4_9ACAR|nr:pyruvate dehydrogenase (acetyl-transferring) E1 component subunit alpha [Hyalomma marginatum]CAG7592894.1 pyruvate dehydrogenase (acetyl-transferring) E1 component subunit alpha [Hyalomma marginatum]
MINKNKFMKINISTNDLHRYYEDMLLLRRFEEKAGQLYGMGLIGGFCHLYIGQEAVAIGIQATLKEGDSVVTSYRDHGIMLATGSEPKYVMAELLGRATGCSKGKGGSMHMFDPAKGFFGGHGIVGAQVPVGTGLAFAAKYNNTDNVCVTIFGDGAVNQGQVYESFNMAKLWDLPVIYIVENNEYAMGTSTARGSSVTEFFKRGEPFGIPGKQVDGMNFFAVYGAMKEAVKTVRKKSSPLLLEIKTYRYRGHSMSDPGRYRSKDEVTNYRENKDPIEQMKSYLLKGNLINESKLNDIEKKVKGVVEEAVKFAQESPEPEISELYTNIYNNI